MVLEEQRGRVATEGDRRNFDAVRNRDKGKAAAAKIASNTPDARITVQQLDLSSLDSIRRAAAELRANFDHIDPSMED
jgi:NAD(P)-dependent dehydrogenase (short-subunit alcohol dehydrogenase family)